VLISRGTEVNYEIAPPTLSRAECFGIGLSLDACGDRLMPVRAVGDISKAAENCLNENFQNMSRQLSVTFFR
jgi:hypothetical protein